MAFAMMTPLEQGNLQRASQVQLNTFGSPITACPCYLCHILYSGYNENSSADSETICCSAYLHAQRIRAFCKSFRMLMAFDRNEQVRAFLFENSNSCKVPMPAIAAVSRLSMRPLSSVASDLSSADTMVLAALSFLSQQWQQPRCALQASASMRCGHCGSEQAPSDSLDSTKTDRGSFLTGPAFAHVMDEQAAAHGDACHVVISNARTGNGKTRGCS